MKTLKQMDMVDSLTNRAMKGNILEELDGLKLLAVGWPMLKKVKGGRKYRIERASSKFCSAVTFYPLKGRKPIVTHNAWSVLESIQWRSNGYLNGFEII